MDHWFASVSDQQAQTVVHRFDPAYWTVDFPRPMTGAVVTTGADALAVTLDWQSADDLAGLIWWSEDRVSHPLLAYATSRDYRRATLRFRWRSEGVRPLDAVNGPVLTVEGRDAAGAPRAWYVRLWNYAVGTPEDATVTLDFGALAGGFLHPAEADPVWAGDVDRMFVSLVPPAGASAGTGRVWMEAIGCDGSGSVLAMGDVVVPPHGLSIATGYDDLYHLTPERVVRQVERLGYRGAIDHYVGMSHWPRLEGGRVPGTGDPIGAPARAWHADWARRLADAGLGLVTSLSFELLDAYCPEDWKQRAADGQPALTGWVPPSTLLSPAHDGAMGWLAAAARAFVDLAVAGGQHPRFQVGEPWWWVRSDGAPCLYDAAARARLGDGPAIADLRTAQPPEACARLDAAGALLAAATVRLFAAVRGDHPDCERLLLAYLPTVLDPAMPEAARANLPLGWASPHADVLQLEDYEWAAAGATARPAAARALATARLGYPVARQHYLAGFVARPEDRAQWAPILAAAAEARARGVPTVFVWALPQVLRDGLTLFAIAPQEEPPMQPFDDVLFPLELGLRAEVSPAFSTQVVTSAGGHEQRNADWASARLRFDAGPGVRSAADAATLLAFFRARHGAARGFRFRDPFDDSSRGMTDAPTPLDQRLGTGDGTATRFPLLKRYGEGADAEARPITRPRGETVRVSVAGVERTRGWQLEPGGVVAFDTAPPAGAEVRGGFRFDVPVRFAEDRMAVTAPRFAAGEIASAPLVEVREPRA